MKLLVSRDCWSRAGFGIVLGLMGLSGCAPEATEQATSPAVAPPQASEATGVPAGASTPADGAAKKITLEEVSKTQLDAAIQAHQGKVVFVDFWATWCAPCKEQFPHTVELAKKYADQGLVVISVSCDEADGKSGALEFLQAKQADFQNFISTDGFNAIDTLEIEGGALPYYRIYNRTGKLAKGFGPDPDQGLSPEQIEVYVKEALAPPAS